MSGRRASVAETVDPDGRCVWVPASTWNGHVVQEHAEMAGLLDVVVQAVEAPEHREDDVRPGRRRFYRRLGRRWLRVVLEFEGDEDRLVTAFLQDNDPR